MVGQCFGEGFAEDDHIVVVARPCVPDGNDAPVSGPADDLHVDASPVVFAFGGMSPVMDGDQGAVDNPQFAPVSRWWSEELGEWLGEPDEGAVCRGVRDAE